MTGNPGLCVLLNATGRDGEAECGNTSLASPPAATALFGDDGAAVLSVASSTWASGAEVAAVIHVVLPLRLSGEWGGGGAVGSDGLVDVTAAVVESSRAGNGRVLSSTRVRFFRMTNASTPNTANFTYSSGRIAVAEMLRALPERRLGMVAVYSGPRTDAYIPTDDTEVLYELGAQALRCGDRIPALKFGLKLAGRSSLTAAVSEASDKALQVLQTIGTVTAMLTLLPTVVLQLGVQGSIREMAQCQGWWVDIDQDSVGWYRLANLQWLSGTQLQQLSSPYGLGVGSLGDVGAAWVGPAANSSNATGGLMGAVRARSESELLLLGQYYRGAILTSLLNLLVFCCVVAGAVVAVFYARRVAKVDDAGRSQAENFLDAAALVQVPSVLMLGLSLLLDGLAEGSMTLMSIRVQFAAEPDVYGSIYRTVALEAGVAAEDVVSGGAVNAPGWASAGVSDMALGCASIVLVVAFVGHVVYVVTGPRRAVVLVPLDHDAHAGKEKGEEGADLPSDSDSDVSNASAAGAVETGLVVTPPKSTPRWKAMWVHYFELREHWTPPGVEGPEYEAGVAWLRKYGMYVGGSTWAPYAIVELAIAFVVTAMEGIVTSDTTWCTVKCGIAVALLCAQLFALVWLKALSARFDLALTTLSVGLSLAVGVLITVNIVVQDPYLTIVADVLTVFASLTVTVFGLVGILSGAIDVVDVIKSVLAALRSRRRRALEVPEDDGDELELPMLDVKTDTESAESGMSSECDSDEAVLNERGMWNNYLNQLDDGTAGEADEEGDALLRELMPPPPPTALVPERFEEHLADVLAVSGEEGAEWRNFLADLEEGEH